MILETAASIEMIFWMSPFVFSRAGDININNDAGIFRESANPKLDSRSQVIIIISAKFCSA